MGRELSQNLFESRGWDVGQSHSQVGGGRLIVVEKTNGKIYLAKKKIIEGRLIFIVESYIRNDIILTEDGKHTKEARNTKNTKLITTITEDEYFGIIPIKSELKKKYIKIIRGSY